MCTDGTYDCTQQDISPKIVNILLVDDDAAYLDLCSRRLMRSESCRFVVSTETSVRDAVKTCLNHQFDCLLVDFQLPDGMGTNIINQLCKQKNIEQNSLSHIPPTIIVSAGGGEHAATQAIRSGAFDFIAKRDVTLSSLERAIRNAVERANLEASIIQRNTALEEANAKLALANQELERRRREIQ